MYIIYTIYKCICRYLYAVITHTGPVRRPVPGDECLERQVFSGEIQGICGGMEGFKWRRTEGQGFSVH